MKQIQSVLDIADDVDGFCIDMWGVLWTGTDFYPPVLPTLQTLKEAGKKIYILSNATKTSHQLAEESAAKGLVVGKHYDAFLSSGSVMEMEIEKGLFEKLGGKKDYRFYMIGYKPHTLFTNILDHMTDDINQADFVYLGSPSSPHGQALNIDHLLPDLKKAIQLKLPAILANPDYNAFHGNIKYCAQGTCGKWYEEHGGKVMWIGKPYPLIYQYALKMMHLNADTVVMVGDTLRTDIAGGITAGMKTLLMTETGITHSELNGLSVESFCEKEGIIPDYYMERFQA